MPSLLETEDKPISLQEAAEKVGIGRRTAVSCKKVLRDGVPELVKAVESGEIRAKPAETTEAEESPRVQRTNARCIGTGVLSPTLVLL